MEKLSRFSVLPVPHTVPLKTPSPSPRCRLLYAFFPRTTDRTVVLFTMQTKTYCSNTHTLQNPPSGSSRLLRGGCEYLAKCAGLVW